MGFRSEPNRLDYSYPALVFFSEIYAGLVVVVISRARIVPLRRCATRRARRMCARWRARAHEPRRTRRLPAALSRARICALSFGAAARTCARAHVRRARHVSLLGLPRQRRRSKGDTRRRRPAQPPTAECFCDARGLGEAEDGTDERVTPRPPLYPESCPRILHGDHPMKPERYRQDERVALARGGDAQIEKSRLFYPGKLPQLPQRAPHFFVFCFFCSKNKSKTM